MTSTLATILDCVACHKGLSLRIDYIRLSYSCYEKLRLELADNKHTRVFEYNDDIWLIIDSYTQYLLRIESDVAVTSEARVPAPPTT